MNGFEPMREEKREEPNRQFGYALLAGLGVALAIGTAAYFLLRGASPSGAGQQVPLPMGSEEQSYARQIGFSDVAGSRAANFLKQEVTYIGGIVTNGGTRSVAEMEVTLEFHDVTQKVILREARRLYGPKETPLGPGEKREFEFAFESMPPDWNQAPPGFVITGLLLK